MMMMLPTILPVADAVIVPVMEGVTTVIVAFIFICVIWPSLIKNKAQFYAAFTAVLIIILLHSLSTMIGMSGFQVFAGALTGLLQIAAIILLFTSAGGLSVKELAGELGRAYEVIRRGEGEKTVIVPLSGEMPKPRQQPTPGDVSSTSPGEDTPTAEKIDLPADAGWPTRKSPPPPDTSSIPLE